MFPNISMCSLLYFILSFSISEFRSFSLLFLLCDINSMSLLNHEISPNLLLPLLLVLIHHVHTVLFSSVLLFPCLSSFKNNFYVQRIIIPFVNLFHPSLAIFPVFFQIPVYTKCINLDSINSRKKKSLVRAENKG